MTNTCTSSLPYERPPYSEILRFRAPAELGEAIAQAAAIDFASSSEFVRRTLVERLRSLGIEPGRSSQSEQPSSTHEVA